MPCFTSRTKVVVLLRWNSDSPEPNRNDSPNDLPSADLPKQEIGIRVPESEPGALHLKMAVTRFLNDCSFDRHFVFEIKDDATMVLAVGIKNEREAMVSFARNVKANVKYLPRTDMPFQAWHFQALENEPVWQITPPSPWSAILFAVLLVEDSVSALLLRPAK